MKHSLLMLLLCVAPFVSLRAQVKSDSSRKARVFVADSDSWESKENSASGFGAAGGILAGGAFGHSGAGARPQTAEIIKTLGQRCPNLTVNNKLEMGDYVLRLEHEGGKGILAHKDKVVVFERRSGDSIFAKSTLSLGGSVQGACDAIDKHWAANAAAITAQAALPSSSGPSIEAEKSTLIVESSIPGADIEVDGEFVGNAPSTLAVTPGKHTVAVKKKGFADWSRTLTISGSAVHLSADLTAAS